jgi:hypothetical protein
LQNCLCVINLFLYYGCLPTTVDAVPDTIVDSRCEQFVKTQVAVK